MSFDTFAGPVVRSPKDKQPKKGKGFSKKEVQQAGLTIVEARKMGLSIDVRRKTIYDENVEVLKQFAKDLKEFAAKVQKTGPSKEDEAAIAKLASLRAVKKAEAELLVEAGIRTFEDLAYCDIPKISNKTGIDEERITAMVAAALKKV